MNTLKITELRKLAKENEWRDLWWYSTDDKCSDQPVKISELPREGTVLVRNEDDSTENWIRFKYPGYVTPEEIEAKKEAERIRNLPTEAQKVALEFFGKSSSTVTRQEASDMLDVLFRSEYSNHEYREFKWKNRNRIYDYEEILRESIYRHQKTTFVLTERINEKDFNEAISRAIDELIAEGELLDFLKKHYSKFFLSEQSRKMKLKNLNESLEFEKEYMKSDSKQGCLSCILLSIIGIVSAIILKNWI